MDQLGEYILITIIIILVKKYTFRGVHIQVLLLLVLIIVVDSLTQLYYPTGVHVDSSGNVYVADQIIIDYKITSYPEITITAGETTGTAIFTSLK